MRLRQAAEELKTEWVEVESLYGSLFLQIPTLSESLAIDLARFLSCARSLAIAFSLALALSLSLSRYCPLAIANPLLRRTLRSNPPAFFFIWGGEGG